MRAPVTLMAAGERFQFADERIGRIGEPQIHPNQIGICVAQDDAPGRERAARRGSITRSFAASTFRVVRPIHRYMEANSAGNGRFERLATPDAPPEKEDIRE